MIPIFKVRKCLHSTQRSCFNPTIYRHTSPYRPSKSSKVGCVYTCAFKAEVKHAALLCMRILGCYENIYIYNNNWTWHLVSETSGATFLGMSRIRPYSVSFKVLSVIHAKKKVHLQFIEPVVVFILRKQTRLVFRMVSEPAKFFWNATTKFI